MSNVETCPQISTGENLHFSLPFPTCFTLETKSKFGTTRAEKAVKEIIKDLNKILPIVIPDNEERAKWIEDLQNILPQRKYYSK